ncbi:MAG: hypothetical protein KGI68_11335 [Alphaproteobacteria bacterium]|nr:hypothetical protein [Alphaproteobacteria bacterium]MDE1986182.1 hypothetical protein [Alphaproteobacteria bacterium]MDE2163284.1 hypothetical protein [Alphaproteobacteria bacterium]MDE2265068.1 hypothetical protein [Alphaproteobacteria bacterium]MDE2500714.1 hypothetical protein [Alphaproteobacteria bacterium]
MSDISESNPKATLGYRLALAGVIFLGVLIVAGVGVLIVGLVKGWGTHAPGSGPAAASPVAAPVHMTLASGYTILSADTQPGRLVLHLRSSEKDEIDIIDLNDGHIISIIQAQAPK